MENNKIIPRFSNFRNLMDIWDEQLIKEADEASIKSFLDTNNFIMYFSFKDNKKEKKRYFGTNEDNRILYSRLKNPSKDDSIDPKEVFTAVDIEKAIESSSTMNQENIDSFSRGFDKSSMKSIKIVQQDDIINHFKDKIKNPPKSHKEDDSENVLNDE